MFIKPFHEAIFRKPDDEGAGGGGSDVDPEITDNQDTQDTDQKTLNKPDDDTKSLLDLSPDDKGGDDADDKSQDDDTTSKTGDEPAKLVFKEKPDWLASNFWNEETGEVNVEGLQKSQSDLRARLSKGEKPPEDPDGYNIQIDEEKDADLVDLEERFLVEGDRDKDPLVQWFKEVAHENELSQQQFNNVYRKYLEFQGEFQPAPVDFQAEVDKMGRRGPALIDGITTFTRNLFDRGVLNEAEAQHVGMWFQRAEDITAFQKIRDYYQDKAPPISDSAPAGTPSKGELRAEMGELMKRADEGEDVAEDHARLQRRYSELYGDEPAGTSQRG